MREKTYVGLFLAVLSIVVVGSYFLIRVTRPPESKPVPYQSQVGETEGGEYFSLFDQNGQVVLETGLPVTVGDEFIDDRDQRYVVREVNGYTAVVQSIGGVSQRFWRERLYAARTAMAAAPIHVCIYHTHSDESYTPTDGTASIRGNGSIYEVGKVLTDSLRLNGVSVYHSQNRHDPHDINAYYRSRRTVFQLLKQQPDAILDVHRDSAPAAGYIASVNGILAARVMLVIGRQDPHINVNLAFARQLRDETNRLYPGLVKGIFIGHGNYNQDLYPTALLVEIGTDRISRTLADNSAHVLADALTVVLKRRAAAS